MTRKRIALVAHDNRKQDLIDWLKYNRQSFKNMDLFCTGTTGMLVEEALKNSETRQLEESITITKLKSGPLGGDQQLGALIAEGKINMMVFFWDPMQPQAHDVDVKALLRITVLYNIPTACNRSTADFLISSLLFDQEYNITPMNLDYYINRKIRPNYLI